MTVALVALFAGVAAAQASVDTPEILRPSLTVLGPTLAFFTAIAAALFNAHLNRRRDDRLRNEEARTLALALQAEVQVAAEILERRMGMLSRYFDEKDSIREWPVEVLTEYQSWPPSEVFRNSVGKLGLLGDLAYDVVRFYTTCEHKRNLHTGIIRHSSQSDTMGSTAAVLAKTLTKYTGDLPQMAKDLANALEEFAVRRR
jgi:hypothetical protein